MQLRLLRLRRAVAVATAGAATIAIGVSASVASAASLDVHYVCDYPLISKNGLQVHVDANVPSTAVVGQPTPAFNVVATTTTEGNTYTGISLTGTTTVDGTAVSKTNVTMPNGSILPLNVPVTIDHYVVPPTAPLTLVARGTAPSITFADAGTAKIDLSDIDLHLLLKKSDGTAVGAALGNGPGSVDDGDPNTNDVKCVLDPAGQNTTLQTVTVSAPAVNTPPTVPGQPSVTNVTESSADVSWVASTDDGTVDHYEVSVNGAKVSDVQSTSTTLTGLTAGTNYSVTVKAVDDKGLSSDPSPAATFTTNTPQADNPPTAPGQPSFTNVTQTSADVSWAASTDDHGVDHYDVFLGGSKVAQASGTSTSLTGLTANTTYSVTVKAVDTAGQSSDASEAAELKTAQTPPPTDNPPSKPGKPSVTNITQTSADVSWTASTDDHGVAGYEVYLGGTKVADAAGTSASLTGLTAGTTYSVTFKAKDTTGQLSDPSDATSFTTQSAPPPGGVTVKFGLSGWTYIKGASGWAGLSGSITANMNLQTGSFTADLALDPTQGHLAIFGFIPVTADIVFTPVGQTTGTLNLKTRVLTSQSKMNLKIPAMKVFGFIPIAGGDTCQSRYPTSITLKSGRGFDPLGGGSVSGKYTMPPLADCGPLTWLINAMTARPGNTINLDLAPQLS